MKILFEVTKNNSNIQGYWKDSKGKLYIDNIKKVIYQESKAKKMFKNGENSVFYCDDSKAYIEDSKGNIQTLNNKIELCFNTLNDINVNELLKQYNGFTLYKTLKKIVIWQE